MRTIAFCIATSITGLKLIAHDVVWWIDPSSPVPVMDFYYPEEFYEYISVAPTSDEPCTVEVNLDPLSSTLIRAEVLLPNPANVVDIGVLVLREPNGSVETAKISGEWHATGLPTGKDCTAVIPNRFSVPITVVGKRLKWQIMPTADGKWLAIDAGVHCTLQFAGLLGGPWLNVGVGQKFKVNSEMPSGFFQRFNRLGGIVSGTVTDPSDKPLSGITLGMPYGGPTASTGTKGGFIFSRLPWGLNSIAISNQNGASLNVVVPATNNTEVVFKVAMDAAASATNACNCTPWCAIGFGSLLDGHTPVYYAGGANPPKIGPANCGQPQVTITPPNGVTSPIVPGSYHHQNSGPDPASGTWTVTTVVCGQKKSCTITVP